MRIKILLLISMLIMIFIVSCSYVPFTGRKQLNLVPDSMVNQMSLQEYDKFMKDNKLSKDTQQTQMVKTVGANIQHAVEQYCAQNNMADTLNGYKWEFNLVEDKAVNAWCMPGGKVVVYTGLMHIARDEEGLAVVMGHEIAHAIAKHGNERMSQGLVVQFGGMALSTAISKYPDQTQNLFMKSYSMGAQYGVLLPYSRVHETEADELGLIFMAMAGYNPNASIDFWQRMSSAEGAGQKPPELLSTHPSDQTRIANLQKFIPEAMKYYKK